jgi:hypothetical protein
MNETTAALKERLINLRDEAIDFFAAAEIEINELYESVRPISLRSHLSEKLSTAGSDLRSNVRILMSEIAQEANHSVLIDAADLRDLSQNTKRMSASLKLSQYQSWGIQIHHDEGDYIGSDPPGQAENDVSIATAKKDFLRAYTPTIELLDLLSAPKTPVETGGIATTNKPSLISYQPGTAFIMMWIDPEKPELTDVMDVVKEVFNEFGVQGLRADDLQHADGITERIIEEIKRSEFLFADLTGERPSVYYEVGYAHAIGKSVILFRKASTRIHFDLAYRNCPEYESIGDLRQKLRSRMRALTNKNTV